MKNLRERKGITLIALVITIIVLIILAAISLIALTGDNGIINKSIQAKEDTEISSEIERIGLVTSQVKMEEALLVEVNETKLQEIVDEVFGNDNAQGIINNEETYIITVNKTNNSYEIDKSGNIEELGVINTTVDAKPGTLEGTGTTADPYAINSIEDLVAFSYNVNSGNNTYEGQIVTLGRSLYFNGLFNSYANENATYEKAYNNSTVIGYIPSETETTTIKELVTTDLGFIPVGGYNTIGTFKGTSFDGKGNYLNNIYINSKDYGGFFGTIEQEMSISNFGIRTGEIIGLGPTAGIVGYSSSNILININNCYNMANIKGTTNVGGIITSESTTTVNLKKCYNTGDVTMTGGSVIGGLCTYANIVEDCYNTGNVSASQLYGNDYGGGIACQIKNSVINCYNKGKILLPYGYVGGIAGSVTSDITIENCYNTGDVEGHSTGGLIAYINNYSVNFINCYNTGAISGIYNIGGIAGGETSDTLELTNCYNTGNISSTGASTGGLVAKCKNLIIENSYNTGKVTGNISTGGLAGNCSNSVLITNSYNKGMITGYNPNTGGIIGYGSGTITNCYNEGDIKSGGYLRRNNWIRRWNNNKQL